jgi:hypothetical protein
MSTFSIETEVVLLPLPYSLVFLLVIKSKNVTVCRYTRKKQFIGYNLLD